MIVLQYNLETSNAQINLQIFVRIMTQFNRPFLVNSRNNRVQKPVYFAINILLQNYFFLTFSVDKKSQNIFGIEAIFIYAHEFPNVYGTFHF